MSGERPHGGSYSGGATALPRPQKAQRSTCCRPDSYIRRSGRVLIFTVRTSPHVIYWVQERQCCQVCAQHPVDSVCLPADRGPEPTSLLCAVCPAASIPWRVFIPRNLDNKDKMNQRESYRPTLIICWAPSCLCRDLPSNCLFRGYLPISTWPQNFEFEFFLVFIKSLGWVMNQSWLWTVFDNTASDVWQIKWMELSFTWFLPFFLCQTSSKDIFHIMCTMHSMCWKQKCVVNVKNLYEGEMWYCRHRTWFVSLRISCKGFLMEPQNTWGVPRSNPTGKTCKNKVLKKIQNKQP